MNFNLDPIHIEPWPFKLKGIAYGQGRLQLQVVVSEHDRTPNSTQLRSAWRTRQSGQGFPLLVIVLAEERAYLCGPSGEDPTVYPNLDPGQVERICKEALEQPNRQAALRSLRDSLGSLESEGLPGLRNEGFLATHELTHGVPNREDWSDAGERSRRIVNNVGKDLLTSLGFTIEPLDKVTELLKVGDRRNGVAILLTEQETPETGSQRVPGNLSPVSYALARADEENLDWVVLIHGRKIRLYPVKMGVGVGRKGRTETYLECHTGLIPDDYAAYLWLLFSAGALAEGGSLQKILNDSKDFAGDLADRLRERIYDKVIPRLAEGLAEGRGIERPNAKELSETYEMAMTVLYRLLFIAYGEDKDLLPYRYNGLYQRRSLKAKAKELLELIDANHTFGQEDTYWDEVKSIFRAVNNGNPAWGVPAYNGGLFTTNPAESPAGAALEEVSLPDNLFAPVLQNLLLVPTAEGGLGPVDFRSLGVREFGTIYEGLLESELSLAETDLTIENRGKLKGTYRPCKEGEDPIVPEGKVYLHNSSGARKSTGSYYTKHFAVEHLLDRSLEPAIDDHFARLDELEELEAGEAFFDFKVADISMGSGHFLVAAVDRIEARFSGYLANRQLPLVAQELDHLRKAGMEALGEAASSYPDFEDNSLLRRLIARRCIYGVDINEVAVQLARLAIWIHTFVPGLPLSLLDRNLRVGNSLVGVGQLSEIEEKIREEAVGEAADGSTLSFFEVNASDFVGDASDALTRLGKLADATRSEVQAARKAWAEADTATAPARALCDILTASRIEGTVLPFDFTNWDEEKNSVFGGEEHQLALNKLDGMNQLHFPVAFPEVFLREREGFDVILGNPPWEEVMCDVDEFWGRHIPSFHSMPQRKRETLLPAFRLERPDLEVFYGTERDRVEKFQAVLRNGPFPGIGKGHPDLYKPFCWRFWFLVSVNGGRIGVVLPRTALAGKGSEEFRRKLFKGAKEIDVTFILNNCKWFFEDIHPQYTIGLVGIERNTNGVFGCAVYLNGPYNSRLAYDSRQAHDSAEFVGEEVLTWNDSASLPLLPTAKSNKVFAQLRKAPRLDLNDSEQWRARPIQGDLNATWGKPLMEFAEECPDGFWPIFKGASLDLWAPDKGNYYAFADPKLLLQHLQEKRESAFGNRKSAFSEYTSQWLCDAKTLPCRSPRIVFRDISRATDSRTVRCALVPPEVILTNKAPYFLFPRGSSDDIAYLLGLLSSIPLDWYARRFVEISLNFHVINPFPIPRPSNDNPLRLRVIELAGRLACPDDRFADWAQEVGVECGPLEDEVKQDMIHELDAVVAHLYGLTEDHLTHVFETFHVGWDYNARLDATINHFRNWEGKS